MTDKRGSNPNSRANLRRGPSPAAAAKGGVAKGANNAARKADIEDVGAAFAEGRLHDGLEILIAEGGRNLAYLLQQERMNKLSPAPEVTSRIESLRKLVNDAQTLRASLAEDVPAKIIAAEVVAKMARANTSEDSPTGPPKDGKA